MFFVCLLWGALGTSRSHDKTTTFGPAVPIVRPNPAKPLLLCGYYPNLFSKFLRAPLRHRFFGRCSKDLGVIKKPAFPTRTSTQKAIKHLKYLHMLGYIDFSIPIATQRQSSQDFSNTLVSIEDSSVKPASQNITCRGGLAKPSTIRYGIFRKNAAQRRCRKSRETQRPLHIIRFLRAF